MLQLSRVLDMAAASGFDCAGVAKAKRLDHDALILQQWLQLGHHGSMDYMTRDIEKRVNPEALVPGCKSVLVCLISYHKALHRAADAPFISESGLSKTDYHLVVKERLQQLEQLITAQYGNNVVSTTHQHLFCDSAPILERRWAQLAGLGAIGKNRQLINPVFGSFVHIGILLLNEETDKYSSPFEEDLCTDCRQCLKACPTGALRSDPFDARKCISYLTIERKEQLPEIYKKAVENVLYGCDTCATVCPYNIHAMPTTHTQLTANETLLRMTADDWQQLSRRQKLKLLHRLAKDTP